MTEGEIAVAVVHERLIMKCRETGDYLFYLPSFNISKFESNVFSREITLGYAHGKILELLVASAGEIVTREKIFAIAWPGRVVTQNSLNQAISVLRSLFGDYDAHIIRTIPRRGYIFNREYLVDVSDPIFKALQLSVETLSNDSDGAEFLDVNSDIEVDKAESSDAPEIYSDASIIKPVNISGKRATITIFNFEYISIFAILVLGLFLIFRIYFFWEEKTWFDTKLIVNGEQSVLLVASDALELAGVERATELVRQRFMSLARGESYLIFNKMHSYLDIICVNSNPHPNYILVYEESISLISDQQIAECLK
ncbi:winged helix-turn-helix domain-containing protein [Pseudomonas fluorescens]|uniref:winged helix-turn-helix domain-containing protein n=1 Tax=Pseudomonas fluorescens TaxID=294 RepID=UPI000CD0C0D3|nr:winged helix-turn-helix domain-containing protein [Pseudomonas fluorescens]PNY78772.1 hypothetical protein C1751_01700 [Pseudomonas fluorescens]